MRIPTRFLLVISVGLFIGAQVYARPLPLSGQDTKAGQTGSTPAGHQGGAAGQAKPGQTSTTPVVTPEEGNAYQAIQSELSAGLDPDKVISLSDEFVQKYPSSALLSYVYFFEASGYQAKTDFAKAVEVGGKSLKANGDNLLSLIMMATLLPQPQLMKGSEVEKEKGLTEADTDANHALELIDKLPKQPNETDDQFKKRKDTISCEVHGALGMIHLQRSTVSSLTGGMDPDELAKSGAEFKKSVEMTDHPAPTNYYRLGEVYEYEHKLDDAIAAYSKASEVGQGTGVQQFADQKIEELKKRQAQAKPPAPK